MCLAMFLIWRVGKTAGKTCKEDTFSTELSTAPGPRLHAVGGRGTKEVTVATGGGSTTHPRITGEGPWQK